jgi:hypothetical protein
LRLVPCILRECARSIQIPAQQIRSSGSLNGRAAGVFSATEQKKSGNSTSELEKLQTTFCGAREDHQLLTAPRGTARCPDSAGPADPQSFAV